MRNSVMIDLETFDVNPTAAIVQIGAVFFDPEEDYTDANGEMDFPDDLKIYSQNIDLQSCIDKGMTMSGDTVMWWMKQGKEAVESLTTPKPINITTALTNFRKWLQDEQKNIAEAEGIEWKQATIYPWGNGSSFDHSILHNAYSATGVRIPWMFWNLRDMRTSVMHAYGKGKPPFQNIGIKHNASFDALSQVIQLQQCFKKIGN